MNVIFSGGPANRQTLEIPNDLQYYHVPVMEWKAGKSYPGDITKIPSKAASYRKTNCVDPQGLVVFEFEGIV